MKKRYLVPEVTIVSVRVQDIVTASPNSLEVYYNQDGFDLNNGEEY